MFKRDNVHLDIAIHQTMPGMGSKGKFWSYNAQAIAESQGRKTVKVETSLVPRLTQRGNLTLWKPPLAAARQGGDGELATGVCSVNTSIPRQPAPTSHKLLPTNLSKEPDR